MLFRPHKLEVTLLVCTSTAFCIGSLAAMQAIGDPAIAAASSAESQSTGELQEVVVTAQRRAEKLQDVPISVEAFTAAQLEASGISSNADLPMVTPGLVFGQQSGGAQPFLRGVGTVAGGPGIENPIALYVDNVYYGAQTGSILSLNNIAQIEVLKGPQGTLFGRNATGGLIQITTKDPSHTFGGSVGATYGNYATAGTDLYVTGGLTDEVAADLSMHFEHQGDGYGENLFTGLPLSKTQDLAARNKWLLTTADGTQVKLSFDYEVIHFTPNYGPAPGTTPLGAPPYPVPPQDTAGIFQPFGKTHQGGASIQIQHDFEFGRFVSITAYRHSTLEANSSASLSIDPAFAIASDATQTNSQISQEFQLLSPSASRVQWTMGAYLYDADGGLTPPAVTTGGLIAPLTYFDAYDHQKAYSAALYGQATTEVAPATNLTLGLRYTVERRDFRGTQTYGFPDGSSADVSDAQHKIFDKPTWRFALDHHFTPDVMGYVSYNRGFKSGGFNDVLVPTTEFAPEVLDAYEIGAKAALFDRRLSLDAAGFYYKYKNIQAFRYLPNGNADIYNGAAAKLYGLDLDAKLRLFENLTLTGAMEVMHTEYTSFMGAPLSMPMEGGGTAYSVGSVAGNRLPLAPRVTTSVTADYVVPMAARGDLTLSSTYAHNSGWYGEPDNRLHQPAYDVVNAQISWNSSDEIYKVRLWGKNLTDAQYTTALGSQPNGDFAVFAPPRTYGVAVSRNF
jgi:iron complex outermembrane receptor protein